MSMCVTTFLVEHKTMNKNAWHMLKSSLHMQRNFEKDNGHSLVPVPKRSGVPWREHSTRNLGPYRGKGCCENLPKAHV